jgi:hypothetical protein
MLSLTKRKKMFILYQPPETPIPKAIQFLITICYYV